VSREALIERFRAGLSTQGAFWQRVLAPETYAAIAGLAAQPDERFTFPPEPWVRAVYDFAVAYNQQAAAPAALMDALTPLYFGRTAGLVLDTSAMDVDAFEGYLEAQAQVFERDKPYLLQRWEAAVGA
jgi:hypothetical protein